MRTFAGTTTFADQSLTLGLAPALEPAGVTTNPSFFSGFSTRPDVLARGLVTLAEITSTRYYQPMPASARDPILSAHQDRLRAECFSACNSVYACLDLLGSGFDGGEIGRGTTNVDLSAESRQFLTTIGPRELLHVDVGNAGLTASTLHATAQERPVEMPERWVRALGNAAGIHSRTQELLRVDAPAARAFLAQISPTAGQRKGGWLTASRTGLALAPRPSSGAIRVRDVHRLAALKRLLIHVQGLSVYAEDAQAAHGVIIAVHLPDARITLALTEAATRGYSGEGTLLPALVSPTARDDADLVNAALAFEPILDVAWLARQTGLSDARVSDALALLAGAGRVGWDPTEGAYFHRELPHDPDRVDPDNPRLASARALVDAQAIRREEGGWIVASGDAEYQVFPGPDPDDEVYGARCTCAWFLRHGSSRGPCKHLLALTLERNAR